MLSILPRSSIAHRLHAPILALGVSCSSMLFAAEGQYYSIAPGPLSQVLSGFASREGVNLAIDPALVQGRKSAGLEGDFHLQNGFIRLLAGTGLRAISQGDGVYTLEVIPQDSLIELEPTQVQGLNTNEETSTGPVQGYVAKFTAVGTKTDTPIIETPRSVSVITRDRMDDQAVQTTEQALRYTSGVLTEVTGHDLRYQSIMVRGFDAANYRDGLRTFAAGSYSDWVAEPQGLERVEVLKGPASVLYGQAAPGGLVNQISKRPTLNHVNQVAVTVGNYDRYQTTFDLGGAFTDDDTVLFRINGLARDSNTQVDYSKDDRKFIAPSIKWQPSSETSLIVLADITRDRITPKSWWPDYALDGKNPNGKISRERLSGEPKFDAYDRDMTSAGYLFEHQLSDDLIFRQNARHSKDKLSYQHVYGDTWQPDMRTINRGILVSRTKGTSMTLDNQLQTTLSTGGIEHKILFGLDSQAFKGREDLGFGSAPSLDVFTPVYGTTVDFPDLSRSHSKLQQVGLYTQDQMRAGPWITNMGIRHDNSKTRNWDDTTSDIKQRDEKTTYSAGLMYVTESGFSPYGSYATSFNPSIDTGFDGVPFKPETGKQVELGIKYQPKNSKNLITLSVFDLRKQNITTSDPDHPGFSVQTGEVRSRGIEIESIAELSRQTDLIVNYTYLDAEITQSNNTSEINKQPRQTAKNTASAWLDYRFSENLLHGWSIGGGVRYVDKVMADYTSDRFNPAYTVFDMAIRYKVNPISLSLNTANVFDKTYVANRSQFYGQGRTVQAVLAYNW